MKRFYYLLPILLAVNLCAMFGQVANCDGNPACIGNMLTFSITSGKTAEYVEIENGPAVQNLDYAITFEAWLKPGEQPGTRQFVAGLWGPNTDLNDQWVVYIEDNTISFELSPFEGRGGATDNTLVSATIPNLYTRGWFHLACVWDSVTTSARIYVDGIQVATASNAAVPLTRLNKIQRETLLTQIGGINGLFDNEARNRTFLGNMDEIRIWNRALAPQEIRCQHPLSLRGNEPGLIVYYRANEAGGSQNLCDASNNGHVGRLRNGVRLEAGTRPLPQNIVLLPIEVDVSLNCTSDTTFTFSIRDTSFCGSDVTLSMIGPDSALFTLSTSTLNLPSNTQRSFTVRANVIVTGQVDATLRIRGNNRCATRIDVPITINRTTELSYSKPRVQLDTLYVGCVEKTYSEDTIELCNTTLRRMTISDIDVGDTRNFSWRPADPTRPLPEDLGVGECWKVIVRANALDSTKTLFDTLRITSTDRCPGSGNIPIRVHTQDVVRLLSANGIRIENDTLKFGNVCPNQISDVLLYTFRNVARDTAFIDSIWFSTDEFFARRRAYPLPLPYQFAFQPDFIRFRPESAGTKLDSMIVRARYPVKSKGDTCTIFKKIYVQGYGIDVDNGFRQAALQFGNVTVGKNSSLTSTAFNDGDSSRFTVYLKVGDVFRITSGRSFNLLRGESTPVDVEFRPREARTYYDTLCIFDQRCYGVMCIPIEGTGVFDVLAFDPAYISLENVIGCQCRRDTVNVENISSSPVTFTMSLDDVSGKNQVVSGPASGTIAPGEKIEYVVEYCPNDLVADRGDNSYLRFDLSDGQRYEVLIRATSVVPKLYVSPLTAFGPVEVGWQRRERVLVENISAVPVHVSSISLPPGYVLLSANPNIPRTLAPRDSVVLDVEFRPTAEQPYNGQIRAISDQPCAIEFAGEFEGSGVIKRLDVPVTFINFGYSKPCECIEREIPLPNTSDFIPMSIDSVWIEASNMQYPNPQHFSWRSRRTNASSVPYTIPPGAVDTLVITFCPEGGISDMQYLINNARFHIRASGNDAGSGVTWQEEFATTVTGRREIHFQPNTLQRTFQTTRVGVQAPVQSVTITVPDQFVNPSGDRLVITNVTFMPDDRVFTAAAANGAPLPWTVNRNENFQIDVGFRPRAPKTYRAKMVIHTEYPCPAQDTGILVMGDGFAQAFGMQFAFDTARLGADTFHISTCDTLVVPVMVDRPMPQEQIDVLFRLLYDSTVVRPLDVTSPYTSVVSISDTGDGARVRLKNATNVVAGEIAYVRFVPRGGAGAFPIVIDQIDFDSDSLVLFKIVAGEDAGWVWVDDVSVAVQGLTQFDTVNLKTCADREVLVWNPGDLPVRFDTLLMPQHHFITASDIPYPTMLDPGDTIRLTVTFCPRTEGWYDSNLVSHADLPCEVIDTGALYSFGYAPPWPLRFLFDANVGVADVISGRIADTIEVPVLVDRYLPVAPVDLSFNVNYNRRSLQFMSATSPYPGVTTTATESGSGVTISVSGIDSLDAGEIARLKFAVAVPDQISSPITIESIGFASDSIFFVKPIPTGDTGEVRVDGKCNVTQLVFRGGVGNKLGKATPNPTSGAVAIDVEFFEDAPARLRLFDASGREVMRLLDGEQILSGGLYRIEFDASTLPTGEYFYLFEARKFSATERLIIVR